MFSVPSGRTVTIGTVIGTGFCTVSDTTPTGQQIVTFTTTANGTAANRINTYPITITENGTTFTEYITITQLA